MSAKILMFDPNRRVPPSHYTPIAMRGRLLYMPVGPAGASSEPASTSLPANSAQTSGPSQQSHVAQKAGSNVPEVLAPWSGRL